MDKQTVAVLTRPLDKRLVKQREGHNGKMLDYVEWAAVARILNEAFNYDWSFEVRGWEIVDVPPVPVIRYNKKTRRREPVLDDDGNQLMEPQPPILQVQGRLVAGGQFKDQFGSVVLFGKSELWADAFKAAASDCLKKCASLFGIALELYSEELPPLEHEDDVVDDATNEDDDWDPEEVARLRELMEALGIEDNDGLNQYVEEFSGGTLTSYLDIGPENLAAFNDYLDEVLADLQ